jgi:hypothetical protein
MVKLGIYLQDITRYLWYTFQVVSRDSFGDISYGR